LNREWVYAILARYRGEWMRLRFAGSGALILLAAMRPGWADVLTSYISAIDTANIYYGAFGTPSFVIKVHELVGGVGVPSVALSGNWGDTSASLDETSDAVAGYGVLHSDASGSYSITGTPATAGIVANSLFQDVLTINDPALNGQSGLLYLTYSLDGTVASTGGGKGFAEVIVQAGQPAGMGTLSQQWDQEYDSNVPKGSTFSLPSPIDFVYGQPFGLSINLDAAGGTFGGYGILNDKTGVGSGTADFGDTLVLSGLVPTNLNGQLAIGATFSSLSGTRYGINGVTPEPSSFGPLLLGLLAITAGLRFRHKALSGHSTTPRDEGR
jgi:hypothetical protein